MVTQPYHRQNLAAAIQQVARQQLEEAGANQLSLRQIARVLAVTPRLFIGIFQIKPVY
ncbi:hypothetical protein V4M49_07860 [Levilactobacillus brevis]